MTILSFILGYRLETRFALPLVRLRTKGLQFPNEDRRGQSYLVSILRTAWPTQKLVLPYFPGAILDAAGACLKWVRRCDFRQFLSVVEYGCTLL